MIKKNFVYLIVYSIINLGDYELKYETVFFMNVYLFIYLYNKWNYSIIYIYRQIKKLKYIKFLYKIYIEKERIIIIKNKYVKEMINDQFGNYVIQKALKVSDYDTQIEIINQIKPQIEQLRQTNIGRKIYEHLMQSYSVLLNDNVNNQ